MTTLNCLRTSWLQEALLQVVLRVVLQSNSCTELHYHPKCTRPQSGGGIPIPKASSCHIQGTWPHPCIPVTATVANSISTRADSMCRYGCTCMRPIKQQSAQNCSRSSDDLRSARLQVHVMDVRSRSSWAIKTMQIAAEQTFSGIQSLKLSNHSKAVQVHDDTAHR
jgi:hypothetical protein